MLRPRAWWNAPDELRRSRARSRNSIRCRLGRLATPCDVSTRCHTPSSQRRAAMVEFALVFPILLAIPVGTVTAGMADNLNNSLNGGARESSRSAATLPVNGDTTAWLNSVADVAPDSTSGDLDASVPGQQICAFPPCTRTGPPGIIGRHRSSRSPACAPSPWARHRRRARSLGDRRGKRRLPGCSPREHTTVPRQTIGGVRAQPADPLRRQHQVHDEAAMVAPRHLDGRPPDQHHISAGDHVVQRQQRRQRSVIRERR